MTDVKELIDELGQLKDTLKTLETREKELTKKLYDLCELNVKYSTSNYELKVVEVINTELDPVKVFNFLKSKDKFLAIASVTKKDAKKLLLDSDIERLSVETGKTKKLILKNRR